MDIASVHPYTEKNNSLYLGNQIVPLPGLRPDPYVRSGSYTSQKMLSGIRLTSATGVYRQSALTTAWMDLPSSGNPWTASEYMDVGVVVFYSHEFPPNRVQMSSNVNKCWLVRSS